MMEFLRHHWDRLGIYFLLMAFGSYSTIYPLISLKASSPYWSSIVLGVEFFVSGLFLILGITRPGFRMAGLLVVCIGLSTISLVVATYGGARVLAYAFLFGAFAMQSVSDIREERRVQQARKKEERQLVEELAQLVKENGQGERL